MSALRRTLKLTIEYDGTDFAGFQRQTGHRSVQAVLEDALAAHLGEEITVVAAGRTDAGVHAAGQVVSFRTTSAMPLRGVVYGTNGILPADVAVLSAEEATPSFHARRDAMHKHYRYRVLVRPVRSPLFSRTAHRIAGPLDVPRMAEAAALLVGRHDFSSFRNAGSFMGDAVRTLSRVDVTAEGPLVTFDVVGDGFLYRMVRNVVGTLLRVGEMRMAPAGVAEILARRDRTYAGPSAPARGLCLVSVSYAAPSPGAVREGTGLHKGWEPSEALL